MSRNIAFPPPPDPIGFDALLDALEAAGEVSRLRLLGLLCEAELTVSELVAILGQSQPRVSRHLKLLVDAGLAERQREGAWAFFRLSERHGALARDLVARIGADDPVIGMPSTVTALPLAPASSVGVGVKLTVCGTSWNSVTPLSV